MLAAADPLNTANRLDRLPRSRFHRTMMLAVAFAYFYEFADTNSFSTTAPQLIHQWGIAVKDIAWVNSVSFIGMFLGAAAGGWAANRWGRKAVLIWTTVLFSCGSLAAAFSWNLDSLALFRAVTSAGLAAMTVVAAIYISELFPARHRGRYQALALVIGICGTPATNLIASLVVPMASWTWRLVYVWGALGVGFLLFVRRLPESPLWLETLGRHDEAGRTLHGIESRVAAEQGGVLPEAAAYVAPVQQERGSVRELFARANVRSFIVLSLLWITQTIGFFGYSSWAPTLLAKQGFGVQKSLFFVALTTVGAPLGSYLAALVTDRFERRWLLAGFGAAIAVSGLLFGMTFNPVLIVAFGFLVNVFERAYTSLAYAYSPELFGTRIRGTATGSAYGLGRLSNAAAPLAIAAIYTGSGYRSVYAFIAGVWLVGALAVGAFGRSTSRRSLAELGRSDEPHGAAGPSVVPGATRS